MGILASLQRETDCSPFISRTSPVTPCGFFAVTLTSLFGTPGWRIDTLEPVSKIKHLGTPSISTETVGAPCSNMIETEEVVTALSGVLGWEELSSFATFTRFPISPLALYLPFFEYGCLSGGCNRPDRLLRSLLPCDPEGFVALFNLVGPSLAKCPSPPHS
jgi:hypothetical protein